MTFCGKKKQISHACKRKSRHFRYSKNGSRPKCNATQSVSLRAQGPRETLGNFEVNCRDQALTHRPPGREFRTLSYIGPPRLATLVLAQELRSNSETGANCPSNFCG